MSWRSIEFTDLFHIRVVRIQDDYFFDPRWWSFGVSFWLVALPLPPALAPAAPAARHASLTGNVGRKIVRGIDRQNSLQLQNQTPHPSINALPPSTGFRIPTSIDRNEWIM